MNIFHVNFTNSGGGLEQYLNQLYIELALRGHQNTLLYGESASPKYDLPGIKTYHIDKITHVKCMNLGYKLARTKELLLSVKPEIVFIHQVLNPKLIELLTADIPSVRFVHGFKLICPEGSKSLKSKLTPCSYPLGLGCQIKAYTHRCMPRNLCLGLSLILKSKKNIRLHQERSNMVVASDYMKSVLIYNGFDDSKIKVIPYFTYLPELDNDLFRTDSMLVLALGRLVKTKGMDLLIKAFKNVKKTAQLAIIGNGPEMQKLKDLTESLKLDKRVSFYGWLSHEKLDFFYRRCSLVVVPSIWPEPFGIVGIEAMAYGKPVVASEVGGISEWCLNKETGLLVDPKNSEELGRTINRLLEDLEYAREMGKKGRKLVKERFIPEAHLDRLISFFENVIAYH